MRCLVAMLALIALCSPALADEPDYSQYAVDARPHVKAAIAAYVATDYATSVREWEAAYAIDRNPQLLYSWAQAERLAKRCGLAIQHYRKYLEFKLTDNQILAARGGISMCLEELDKATCTDKPVDLHPKAEPTPRDPEQRASPWYPIGAVGVGGLGIGVGIGYLIAAHASHERATTAKFSDDHAAALDEATRQRRIGITTLSVGVALGGVSVGLFLHHRSADKLTVHASAGAGSASLTIGGPL